MITDGGPEFRGDFAQSGEYAGILQVIVDADAPDDLEDLLAEIVSLKNRRGNRGGFTLPTNLSLARIQEFRTSCYLTIRVDEVGLQELDRDDANLDSPAKAFRQIRDHARMLMETHTAREQLRFNCIEIETITAGSGCMCGEEICVEQEIELAVHRSPGGLVQDLSLSKMAPLFGCQ